MSDGPFFTVVVATFDRGQHIIPTIESALGQTFKDFELLIVRDGSKDNALERVTCSEARVGVIDLPWNPGSQATPTMSASR